MPLTARVWSLGKLLLLAGALVVTFFGFALVGMRLALRTREVQVPDLVGAPIERATQIAADLGLGLRVDPNPRPDERIPAGSVLQQDPTAGEGVRQQRTLRVWVSSGPRSTMMPGLVGQSERTARLRVGEDGIEVVTVSEFRSPEYSADAVVSQDPPPGSRAPRVSLLVNRGESSATYLMPDLTGLAGERAAEVLRTRGLRVSIVGSQPAPGLPAGTVVRQQPAEGFQIGPSDSISLEVSR
ncbi:MAG: PASTA domain-containing protein [Acidobacteria bacterium]|nr:PASTA domain-containing protein [Acidobacteriota bacterium]